MSKKKTFLSKLKDKYRLVIINDSSFEEKFAFKLSRWNVIMLGATFSVVLAFLMFLAIIFTPLKTMIPGYSDAQTKKNARMALATAQRLEGELQLNEAYLFNLKKVLTGDLEADSVSILPENKISYDHLDYTISRDDSLLRKEIEEKEQYNIKVDKVLPNEKQRKLSDLNFFCPLRGDVSSEYQASVNHLGVDIVAPENETIKSILDGVVILSNWSSEEGYVIAIQHADQVISIYKHNSVLLKETGDMIKVGESIAVSILWTIFYSTNNKWA